MESQPNENKNNIDNNNVVDDNNEKEEPINNKS